MARPANSTVSAMVFASLSTSAPIPPVESTLTCATQRSCSSAQKWSAYQVEAE